MKNTISEMKNTLEGIKSSLGEAENQTRELGDIVGRNTQSEQQNEKILKKNEGSLRELQDNMKHNNIHITGISEREEKDQGIEKLSKNYGRKLPYLGEGKSCTSSGSTEGPNQDESKQVYSNAHHN